MIEIQNCGAVRSTRSKRWAKVAAAVALITLTLSTTTAAASLASTKTDRGLRADVVSKDEVNAQYEQMVKEKLEKTGKPLSTSDIGMQSQAEGDVWIDTYLWDSTDWFEEDSESSSTLAALRPLALYVLNKFFKYAGVIVNTVLNLAGLAEDEPAAAGVDLRHYYYSKDVYFSHDGYPYLAGWTERRVTWRREWAEAHVWVDSDPEPVLEPVFDITSQIKHEDINGCHYYDTDWLEAYGENAYEQQIVSGHYWSFTEDYRSCWPDP